MEFIFNQTESIQINIYREKSRNRAGQRINRGHPST